MWQKISADYSADYFLDWPIVNEISENWKRLRSLIIIISPQLREPTVKKRFILHTPTLTNFKTQLWMNSETNVLMMTRISSECILSFGSTELSTHLNRTWTLSFIQQSSCEHTSPPFIVWFIFLLSLLNIFIFIYLVFIYLLQLEWCNDDNCKIF